MPPKTVPERRCSVLALAGNPAEQASLKLAVICAAPPQADAAGGGGGSAQRWVLPQAPAPPGGKATSRLKLAALALAWQALGLDLRSRLYATPVLNVR